MALGGIDHDSIMIYIYIYIYHDPTHRAQGDLTLKKAELPSRISKVAGGMPGFVTDHVTGKSGRIDVENLVKYGAWILLYSIYQYNVYIDRY